MRRITVCVVAALIVSSLQGQSLRFVRTDPTANPTAITATRLFGFDIVADSITSVTAVSLELRYTYAQYIRLAAWKPRQLSRHSVYVIDLSDTISGDGSIHIAVLSGIPSTGSGMNSPTVVHLDFVVLPNAPHQAIVQFQAQNAEAVIAGAVPQVIPLRTIPAVLQIHGYITVFPGDANNDGRVDQRDFSTVALYLGQGSGSGQLRGYTRQPASTLWQPQRALSWEDEQATYADCDGSGDITLADALVVKLNYDSTHTTRAKASVEEIQQLRSPLLYPVTDPFTIPIAEYAVSAVALDFVVPYTHTELGIISVDPSWKVDFFLTDTATGHMWCVLSVDKPLETPRLHLQFVASDPFRLPPPYVHTCFVLRQSDNAIVPVGALLSNTEQVEENNRCPVIAPLPATQTLHIVAPKGRTLRLYASDGRFVGIFELSVGANQYPIEGLSNGVYWLIDPECTVPVFIVSP